MNFLADGRRSFSVILLLAALSLIVILSMRPGGIGGTGLTDKPGGIGGTGIYGRITGFGSIWVNGIEIHYDEDHDILHQGQYVKPDDLAIGQIVAVIATEMDGRYEATTIDVVEEVNGPLEISTTNHLKVMGQDVIINDDTVIDISQQQLRSIGSHIAVSGFRDRQGFILASRISDPLSENNVYLRGNVRHVDGDSFWIEDQKIITENHSFKNGDNIEVSGIFDRRDDGNILIAQSAKKENILPFENIPEKISYQGLYNQTGMVKISVGNINLNVGDVQNINSNVTMQGTKIAIITGSTDIFKSLGNDQDVVKLTIRTENIDVPEKSFQLPSLQSEEQQTQTKLFEGVRKELKIFKQGQEKNSDKIDNENENLQNENRGTEQQLEDRINDEIDAREKAEKDVLDSARKKARDAQRDLEKQRQGEYKARREALRNAERIAREEARISEELMKDRQEIEREARRLIEMQAREEAKEERRSEARREAELEAKEQAEKDAKEAALKQAKEAAKDEAKQLALEEARRSAMAEARQEAEKEAREEALKEARNLAEEEAKRIAEEAKNN